MSGAWWAAAGASLWCVSRAAAGQKHPVKALLANAVLGVAALGAVELAAKYTAVSLPLNWFTAFVSVVLGAPGVILLLLLRLWI